MTKNEDGVFSNDSAVAMRAEIVELRGQIAIRDKVIEDLRADLAKLIKLFGEINELLKGGE